MVAHHAVHRYHDVPSSRDSFTGQAVIVKVTARQTEGSGCRSPYVSVRAYAMRAELTCQAAFCRAASCTSYLC